MRIEQKVFNNLIETIVSNSENNVAKITNVKLWANSWKIEMEEALNLTDVTKRNWFEKLPLHWKLLYYFVGGIIVGLLLPYVW